MFSVVYLTFFVLFFVVSKTGISGSQGTGTNDTTPGGRQGASSWTDADGTIRLFGGQGFARFDSYSKLAFVSVLKQQKKS